MARALDCGSKGRGFEFHYPPCNTSPCGEMADTLDSKSSPKGAGSSPVTGIQNILNSVGGET